MMGCAQPSLLRLRVSTVVRVIRAGVFFHSHKMRCQQTRSVGACVCARAVGMRAQRCMRARTFLACDIRITLRQFAPWSHIQFSNVFAPITCCLRTRRLARRSHHGLLALRAFASRCFCIASSARHRPRAQRTSTQFAASGAPNGGACGG